MKKQGAFTLIELLVVVAIIGLLATIIIVSMSEVRKNTRDKIRIVDLEQIHLALRLYAEEHGHYPCAVPANCPGQVQNATGPIGEGGYIDSLLAPYLPEIPHDPLGPGNPQYRYFYDPTKRCDGRASQISLFAQTLETSKFDNFSQIVPDYCSDLGLQGWVGGITEPGTHIIIIGDSTE